MFFLAAGQTDIGPCRSRNEDRISIDSDLALFVVADGVGGQAGGAIASTLGVEAVREAIRESPAADPDTRLAAAVREANRRVCAAAREQAALREMGSTLTAALVQGERLALAWVGDSRAYLVRDGAIRRLSEDHTLAAEQVRLGLLSTAEAEYAGGRSLITRALGQEGVEVGTAELLLHDGDRVLLCTDGLTEPVPDQAILLVAASAETPRAACRRLVEIANCSGGRDNVSLIAIHFFADGWRFRWRRFLGRFRR